MVPKPITTQPYMVLDTNSHKKETTVFTRHIVSVITFYPWRIWRWDQIHCVALEIIFPTSTRTPESDSVCESYGLFSNCLSGCPEPNPNWILSWIRVWIGLSTWEVWIWLENLIQNLWFKSLGSSLLLSHCMGFFPPWSTTWAAWLSPFHSYGLWAFCSW